MTQMQPTPGMVQCEITGQWLPEDEVVVLHGTRVGAEGKQILLEQLRSGQLTSDEVEVPTFLRRFGCWLLDVLLMSVAVALLSMLGLLGVLGTAGAAGMEFAVQGVISLLQAAAVIAYFGLMHGHKGQTVGKMAGQLKVVNVDASPLTPPRGILRAFYYPGLGYVFSGAAYLLLGVAIAFGMAGIGEPTIIAVGALGGIYFIADLITMLVNRQQRSLHDLMAGTRVIYLGD